jgi:dihydroorotase
MSAPLVIANARIVDPASGRDETGAVLVENGQIGEVVAGGAPGQPENAEFIDAAGEILAPGLIDLRVFTGEPGHEYRETLASAAVAAAAGGITSMLIMPDTNPAIDEAALVDFILRRAKATASVNVLCAGALTRGCKGAEVAEYGLLKEAGALCFSDGRRSLQSTALLRIAFDYAANFNMPVIHQPLDTGLAAGGVMNEGLFGTVLGLPGIPAEAESIPLARDLQLARLTGVTYHAAQVSAATSVDLLGAARQHNMAISAGVSINNLALNENDIGAYRTFLKLSPPLRSEADRLALIEGLKSGAITTIHSDHDPQDVEVKRRPFAEAAYGAVGLETLLCAALRLVHGGQIDLKTVLAALTCNPARFLGLKSGRIEKGAPADIILIDYDAPFVVRESELRSRSANTAFEGALMTGRVTHTFVGGKPVFERNSERDQ